MSHKFLAILFFIFSVVSHAEIKSVTGIIDKVQVMGTNYQKYSTEGVAIAFIHMDELPLACKNTTYRRVAITSGHPAFQVVVSTALAAKAAGQSVELFYVDECTLWNNNAWDFSVITTQ